MAWTLIPEQYKGAVDTPLAPQQKRVVKKLQAGDGLLMYHGMGSGKTLSALAAADALDTPLTVVGPAGVRSNFQREHAKHQARQALRYHSYEKAPAPGTYPLVFFDEAHRMGRMESQKSRLAEAVRGRKVLLGTGTPIRNEPAELVPLLRAVGVDLPRDRRAFNQRFVEEVQVNPGLFNRLFRGIEPGTKQQARNLQEFGRLVRGKVDYYRAGTEGYPAVQEQTIRVPMSPKQEAVYHSVMRNTAQGGLPGLAYKVQHGLPPSKREARQLNAFLGAARQVSNTPAAYALNADPVRDAPKIQRAAREIVRRHKKDPNYRGVTYSNYLASGLEPIAEQLKREGVRHGFFTGSQTPKQRAKLLDDYRAGQVRHLLISSAGAEGLDLKGTKLLQILEPHWNDARLAQAEARAVRYRSHDHLPAPERKVTIQRFLSEPAPKRSWLPWRTKPVQGVDEYLRGLSKQKSDLNQAFLDTLATEGHRAR